MLSSAPSTNWNAAILPSNLNQMKSDIANSMSVVTIAIQRAVRATSLPPASMMRAAPSSGAKVTMLRMWEAIMARHPTA